MKSKKNRIKNLNARSLVFSIMSKNICQVLCWAFLGLGLSKISFAQVMPVGYQKGWNFVCWYRDCVDWELNEGSFKRMKETGASHLTLVVNWYVESLTDSELKKYIPPRGKILERQTYTDRQVLKIAQWAKEYGFKLVIKPHVEVLDQGVSFRGFYHPRYPGLFFATYLKYFLNLLQVLKPYHAEISDIVVGTELTVLSHNAAAWKNIIQNLRAVVPQSVKMTYAANWFDFYLVRFWNHLDWIGIDAYYPLNFYGKPTVNTMMRNWSYWGTMLSLWRDIFWPKKSLGFTETGFVDNKGSTRFSFRPWENKNPVDELEQANAFKATLELVQKISNFHALYWWVWDIHAAEIPYQRHRYQTTGRLAEKVLQEYWR